MVIKSISVSLFLLVANTTTIWSQSVEYSKDSNFKSAASVYMLTGTSNLHIVEWNGVEACSVSKAGIVVVNAGHEKYCWEMAVAAHNQSMDTPAHDVMDKALRSLAIVFGKPRWGCIK